MKKLRLEVIKLNNNDVIATSCANASFYFLKEESGQTADDVKGRLRYNENVYVNGRSNAKNSYEAMNLGTTIDSLDAGYYHIGKNGEIEACPDSDFHDNWESVYLD